MAFYTITVAPGLSPAARRRALRAGPVAAWSRSDHAGLLASAGFVRIDETEVTDEYRRVAHAWLNAAVRHEVGLRDALGDAAYEERQSERIEHVAAIDSGLLRRSLFVASRPS